MKTAVTLGETKNNTSIQTEGGRNKWAIHTNSLPGHIVLKLPSTAHLNVGLRSGVVGLGQIHVGSENSKSTTIPSFSRTQNPLKTLLTESPLVQSSNNRKTPTTSSHSPALTTSKIEEASSLEPTENSIVPSQIHTTGQRNIAELASQVASASPALPRQGDLVVGSTATPTSTASPSVDIHTTTQPLTSNDSPSLRKSNIGKFPSSDNLKRGSTVKDETSSGRKSTENKGYPQPNGKEKASDKLESSMMAEAAKLNSLAIRFQKFKNILETPNIDLDQLRKLSWKGVPDEIRPMVWQILMGYLPCNLDRREATLARKRSEYAEYVDQSFAKGKEGLDQALYHQIHIDIQRTNSNVRLYQDKRIQEALERILYCWAIRHPASGYVQGINDLVTPFFQVFLCGELSITTADIEAYDVNQIPDEELSQVEADSFWCLTKLLDGIQDNYTSAQPGIQRQIGKLKELITRIDPPLATHLQAHGVEFIQFAFRWMNCLLMRELSIKNTIRMWDTYQAEGPDGFSDFHLYVCASFLVKWSEQLRKMEFQDIMMFLQSLPTQAWEDKEIEVLLSEAFVWKSLFTPGHLQNTSALSPQQ